MGSLHNINTLSQEYKLLLLIEIEISFYSQCRYLLIFLKINISPAKEIMVKFNEKYLSDFCKIQFQPVILFSDTVYILAVYKHIQRMLIKEFHTLALELIRRFGLLKLIHHLLKGLLEFLWINRLQYIVNDPKSYGTLRIIKLITATEYDTSKLFLLIYHIVYELYSIHERHLHICEQYIIVLLPDLLQGIKSVHGFINIKFHIQFFQQESDSISLYSLVIHDQYSIHFSTAFPFTELSDGHPHFIPS